MNLSSPCLKSQQNLAREGGRRERGEREEKGKRREEREKREKLRNYDSIYTKMLTVVTPG